MENTSYFIIRKGTQSAFTSAALKRRPFASPLSARIWAFLPVLACAFSWNLAFGQEWSEKDLTKSVHRAESTFESGEMSRAYGLFAHLVSVASDRPFLHYRFGAICTYTGTRLEEAEEHLVWANELGVLETEHKAGWNYYMGKLRHLQYRFDDAKSFLNDALDLASGKEDWLKDAKLRYGQCNQMAESDGPLKSFDVNSSLESHSSDFFRLYQLPQKSGRLLVTPESLLGKEDVKRGYKSIMHWLPGERFAFFSSYGKKGDTGLDVYRVSVSSSGTYGLPEKLPEPVNSDFDDSHPICIPAENAYIDPDLLYFSSSRPESMGGMDIFQVFGLFTGESLGMVARETLEQLPFEINSTHDEWLFWFDESSNKGWMSTNRLKDFEGKEIWQFEWGQNEIVPVSIRIELADKQMGGVLKVLDQERKEVVIERTLEMEDTWDVVVAAGAELNLVWQDFQGTVHPLNLSIPELSSGHVALETALLGSSANGGVDWKVFPSTFIPKNDLSWSDAARESRHRHGTWIYEATTDESLAYRMAAESNDGQFNASRRSVSQRSDMPTDALPNWFVEGIAGLDVEALEYELDELVSSKIARARALVLQGKLEALFCWAAPGSNGWKAHDAIERIGEPVLASIAQEAYELKAHVKNQSSLWKRFQKQIDKNVRLNPEKEAELIALKMYLNNHLLAFKGAEGQSDDLIRRIEVHLQFERWLSDAFPMDLNDEFQSSLVHLTLYEDLVSRSVCEVGESVASGNRSGLPLTNLQSIVWQSLVDSIIDVKSLGVYDLPEMEPAKKWFIRSGSLMDEIQADNRKLEAIGKGRRSISLAWDAFQEGKQKRDLVYADVPVSSGKWWENFGPNDTGDVAESFAGYELFVKGNAVFIEQAGRYQDELDLIRMESPQSKSGREAVKKAIAIRSNMVLEMESMFGSSGNESFAENEALLEELGSGATLEIKSAKSVIVKESSKANKANKATASYTAEVSSVPDVVDNALPSLFSVQIGAFRNTPDWSFDAKDLKTKVLENGLTSYSYGSYATKLEAAEAMKSLIGLIPDAFIVTRSSGNIQKNGKQGIERTEGQGVTTKSSVQTASSPSLGFRVKVASFGADLKPKEVAKMLRFGNELTLKAVRLSNSTTYYSEITTSATDAQRILELCFSEGFHTAAIETLD